MIKLGKMRCLGNEGFDSLTKFCLDTALFLCILAMKTIRNFSHWKYLRQNFNFVFAGWASRRFGQAHMSIHHSLVEHYFLTQWWFPLYLFLKSLKIDRLKVRLSAKTKKLPWQVFPYNTHSPSPMPPSETSCVRWVWEDRKINRTLCLSTFTKTCLLILDNRSVAAR